MHIHAPFDGTVVEKQGEVGEIISPMAMSSSLGRSAVVTLADLAHMDVETDISENMMSRIDVGQPAEVSVSANPNKRYQGRLRQIIPMGDRTRGTVKVKVEILDPDDKLFPELAATVHFLPFKTGPGGGGQQGLPLRAQVRCVPGERARLRLGRGEEVAGQQAAGRGGHDDGRPGPCRVWPRVRRNRGLESSENVQRQ